MELDYINALNLGGFNYDNCIRNKAIESGAGVLPPRAMKTGTTICGAIYKVSHKNSYPHKYFIMTR
jgi:hypothetical protein